jgi:hypothetical protein
MRLRTGRRTSTIVAAGAVAAGAAGVIGATPSAQAQTDHQRHCIRLHTTENTPRWYTSEDVPPGGAGPGFIALYFGELYDAKTHAVVGHSGGSNHLLYTRPSDGAVIQYVDEQFDLGDGSFIASGSMSRQDVISLKWVSEPLRGTSGKYLGMTGTWKWRLMSTTDPNLPTDEIFTLCGK